MWNAIHWWAGKLVLLNLLVRRGLALIVFDAFLRDLNMFQSGRWCKEILYRDWLHVFQLYLFVLVFLSFRLFFLYVMADCSKEKGLKFITQTSTRKHKHTHTSVAITGCTQAGVRIVLLSSISVSKQQQQHLSLNLVGPKVATRTIKNKELF